MRITYFPERVCCDTISYDIDDNNVVTNLVFAGGCKGNLLAISKILDGWKAEKIIDLLDGNRCGFKNTSCTDQLVQSLKDRL